MSNYQIIHPEEGKEQGALMVQRASPLVKTRTKLNSDYCIFPELPAIQQLQKGRGIPSRYVRPSPGVRNVRQWQKGARPSGRGPQILLRRRRNTHLQSNQLSFPLGFTKLNR